MTTTTTVKQVECEFDDIYRITCENGLVLDISEDSAPKVGSEIEYSVYSIPSAVSTGFTLMNGILFQTSPVNILVSFGGLLGDIPVTEQLKATLTESVSVVYCLKN